MRRDGTQKDVVDTMQTRAELYEYLGYHAYEQQARRAVRASESRTTDASASSTAGADDRPVAAAPKPKKSVALSGVAAGNTALCTVGRTGNDLHYRGYDILDIAEQREFEEIAYLLVHGKLPNARRARRLQAASCRALRGLPAGVQDSARSACPPARTRWT